MISCGLRSRAATGSGPTISGASSDRRPLSASTAVAVTATAEDEEQDDDEDDPTGVPHGFSELVVMLL